MPALKKRLQRTVIALQSVPPLKAVFRLYYLCAAWLFMSVAHRAFPQIIEIFLRRGQTKAGWTPGASDLDFGVIVRPFETIDAETGFLKRFWDHWKLLKALLPVLGEVQILDTDQAARLRSFSGLRLREYSAAPSTGWKLRWECLNEALFSCLHLLEQTYFESAGHIPPPDFGLKIVKGAVDVLRHAEAARSDGAIPQERGAFRTTIADASLRALLESPSLIGRAEALAICCQVLQALDGCCQAFVSDATAAGLTKTQADSPAPAWPRDVDEEQAMLWNGRMKIFDETPGYPPVRGFYYDSLFRWLVVAETSDVTALKRLFAKLEVFPAENDVFRAPAWVLPPAALQALLWTTHLGTPFFYWCLNPELPFPNTAGRRRGRFAIDSWGQRGQWRMKAADFMAPPAEFLRYGAEACAADMTLSLRLFGLESWAGDNIYRLCFLYSRLLSLHLYFKDGLAVDPDDLGGLVSLFAKSSPELFSTMRKEILDALETPPQEWNMRSARDCFYLHYPHYRALLDDVLAHQSNPAAVDAGR